MADQLSTGERLRLIAETYIAVNGTSLRRCRLAVGLSQAEVARKAGTTSSTISRLEAGGCRTRPLLAARIAETLEIRPELIVRLPPRSTR